MHLGLNSHLLPLTLFPFLASIFQPIRSQCIPSATPCFGKALNDMPRPPHNGFSDTFWDDLQSSACYYDPDSKRTRRSLRLFRSVRSLGSLSSLHSFGSLRSLRQRFWIHENASLPQYNALCCVDPDVCRVITPQGVPFCYNNATTLFTLQDSTFGFIANGTYYLATGVFEGFFAVNDYSEFQPYLGPTTPLPSRTVLATAWVAGPPVVSTTLALCPTTSLAAGVACPDGGGGKGGWEGPLGVLAGMFGVWLLCMGAVFFAG